MEDDEEIKFIFIILFFFLNFFLISVLSFGIVFYVNSRGVVVSFSFKFVFVGLLSFCLFLV